MMVTCERTNYILLEPMNDKGADQVLVVLQRAIGWYKSHGWTTRSIHADDDPAIKANGLSKKREFRSFTLAVPFGTSLSV